MRAGDVAGDGEAEACAAFVLIAGFVQPHEWPEYIFATFLRDAWAVIVHDNRQPALCVRGGDGHRLCVAEGIGDQIIDQSCEGVGANIDDRFSSHNMIELAVTDTEPGVKGDTVSNVTKAATLETGAVVQVPLFVNVGDRIKVDPREGRYISRA